jgi:uncharacterized phage infection (PIP) family protein YhgE
MGAQEGFAMSYLGVISEFPSELQPVMLKFAEAVERGLREQFAVRREDLVAVQTELSGLAAAQRRTEEHLQTLAERVDRLAAAQERTEERLSALVERVDRLAAAQERTEERLSALAAAQERTEERLNVLAERVDRLAAAQERTEERLSALAERVDRLAAAQERTEERLNGLTAAQERTEQILASLIASVEQLTKALDETNRQLGGLAITVGYQLEDMAYRALPALLARDHNLIVEGRLKRGYLMTDQGAPTEVNILGAARRNGEKVTIVGESKAQLSKNDIDRFLQRKVARLASVYSPVFPVLVTYMTSEPGGEAYAQDQDVALYYSYDFSS